MFNANSVWFGPGEEKATLPLVYLPSISTLCEPLRSLTIPSNLWAQTAVW